MISRSIDLIGGRHGPVPAVRVCSAGHHARAAGPWPGRITYGSNCKRRSSSTYASAPCRHRARMGRNGPVPPDHRADEARARARTVHSARGPCPACLPPSLLQARARARARQTRGPPTPPPHCVDLQTAAARDHVTGRAHVCALTRARKQARANSGALVRGALALCLPRDLENREGGHGPVRGWIARRHSCTHACNADQGMAKDGMPCHADLPCTLHAATHAACVPLALCHGGEYIRAFEFGP